MSTYRSRVVLDYPTAARRRGWVHSKSFSTRSRSLTPIEISSAVSSQNVAIQILPTHAPSRNSPPLAAASSHPAASPSAGLLFSLLAPPERRSSLRTALRAPRFQVVVASTSVASFEASRRRVYGKAVSVIPMGVFQFVATTGARWRTPARPTRRADVQMMWGRLPACRFGRHPAARSQLPTAGRSSCGNTGQGCPVNRQAGMPAPRPRRGGLVRTNYGN